MRKVFIAPIFNSELAFSLSNRLQELPKISFDALPIDIELLEFVVLSVVAIALAILALEYHDIVYGAFFFGIMSTVVAGFYLLLDAPFIAMVQMAVYTGAITVLIIFGVLLVRREGDHSLGPFPSTERSVLGILLAIVVAGLMVLVAIQFAWPSTIPPGNYEQAKNINFLASELWGRYALAVELMALALLTAMVGGIALLRMEKKEHLAIYGVEVASASAESSPAEE